MCYVIFVRATFNVKNTQIGLGRFNCNYAFLDFELTCSIRHPISWVSYSCVPVIFSHQPAITRVSKNLQNVLPSTFLIKSLSL